VDRRLLIYSLHVFLVLAARAALGLLFPLFAFRGFDGFEYVILYQNADEI
jgi:hypothetical protein